MSQMGNNSDPQSGVFNDGPKANYSCSISKQAVSSVEYVSVGITSLVPKGQTVFCFRPD